VKRILRDNLQARHRFPAQEPIQSIQASIQEYAFRGAKPFPFEFDSQRLTLTEGATFKRRVQHADQSEGFDWPDEYPAARP
jgi:hypothetical protein